MKPVSSRKAEWQGLTESEIRTKLHTKLDATVPSGKVDQTSDKIVDGMRRRRVLGEEAVGDARAAHSPPDFP